MDKSLCCQQRVRMCADLPLRNNLNPRFHPQRSQYELGDYLKARRDPLSRRAPQTLRDVLLSRYVNRQVKKDVAPRHLVIVLYQFLTSLKALIQGC